MSVSGRANILEEICKRRISAIIRTDDQQLAADAMAAAVAGGFRIVEFTLTTPGALDAIQEFSGRDGVVVGAGTVLSVEDAHAAVRHGARYLVSPVVDEAVITLKQVSGSATTNEGHDLMVSLYRADGGLLMGGVGFLHHITSAALS